MNSENWMLSVVVWDIVRKAVGIERPSCILIAVVHNLGNAKDPSVAPGAVLMPNPIAL